MPDGLACPLATSSGFDGWLRVLPYRTLEGRISLRPARRRFEAYLVSSAFVCAATLIRLAVDHFVVGSQFATYFLAAVASTLCGGMCAGLCAIALSLPPAWFLFLAPQYTSLSGGEAYSVFCFILVAAPIVYITSQLQGAAAVIQENRMRAAVAEERARSAEELRRWKHIFDNITVGIAVYDAATNTISLANKAFAALHGLHEDECIGMSPYDLYPPADHEWLAGYISTSDRVGHVTAEVYHRRKDGSIFPVRSHGTSVRSTNGEVIYRIATAIDISAERELETRLTDVFNSAAIGISIVDPASNIIRFVNPAYAAFHAMSIDEIQGKSIFDLYRPSDRERIVGLKAEADSRGVIDYEADHIRKDGSAFPARVHVTSVRSSNGQLRYRISTVQNIARERELQAELDHTRRLEAIGQLGAGVAHDFNNLLQGMISHLELVDDDVVPDATREKVGTAIRLAEQAGSLAQQLLSFGRKQFLLPQEIAVHDFLDSFARLLSRTLDPRIRIELSIASDLKTLEADPTHLRTALLNVAINARDAMPSGGHLLLEAGHAMSADDTISFRITDTGCGIAPENLDRICEPFFSTKGLNGTGLGLSMVYGFVKQSGGDLRITSELGVGTCVELLLPARSDRDQVAA